MKGENSMREESVISVVNIPINTLTAVYYIDQIKEIWRQPILFGAVVHKHECGDEYDSFELWTVSREGDTDDCRIANNFLGIEVNGVAHSWTEEIKDYLEREKQRCQKK